MVNQRDLAEMLGAEWTEQSVSRYLNGKRTPPPEFITEAAIALKLTKEEEKALFDALSGDIWRDYIGSYLEYWKELK